MTKEEILKKSRNEIQDEGNEYFGNKGAKNGFIIFVLIFIIIGLTELMMGPDMRTFHAFSAVAWGFCGCIFYQTAKYKHSKTILIASLIDGLLVVISLMNYFRVLLK